MDELPPPLNDKQLYDFYYQQTRTLNNLRHRFWQRKICSAKMHGCNPPVWVSVVEGHGIIGSFATEEEANQRAFCAAMMFDDEKSGKLGRIKKLLDQRSWTRATDADSESQREEQPVSENIAGKQIGAASAASNEKGARGQNVPPNGPRTDEPMSDESPEERLDATHVDERPVYKTEGGIVARQAIVDATLQAVVGPSSKPGIDDINANEPKPMATNATSIAGFSGANPHVSLHVLGDTHLENPGALKRPVSALTAQTGVSSANRPFIATAAAQSAPVARNESGQGTEGKQLSSLNKRKIDGSNSDAPKKQRVLPVIPSGFNTKAVEMRNPDCDLKVSKLQNL